MGSWPTPAPVHQISGSHFHTCSEPASAAAAMVAKLARFCKWPSSDCQPRCENLELKGPQIVNASIKVCQKGATRLRGINDEAANHESNPVENRAGPKAADSSSSQRLVTALSDPSAGLTPDANDANVPSFAIDTAASKLKKNNANSPATSAVKEASHGTGADAMRKVEQEQQIVSPAGKDPQHARQETANTLPPTHNRTRSRSASTGINSNTAGTLRKPAANRKRKGKSRLGNRTNYKALIGKEVDIPAAVFDIQVPGLRYTARVLRKDTGHPGAVVIRFKEDGSSFWLPAAEVWRYVREGEARSRADQSASGIDACAEFAAEVLCSMSGNSQLGECASTSAATAGQRSVSNSQKLGMQAPKATSADVGQQATSALSAQVQEPQIAPNKRSRVT